MLCPDVVGLLVLWCCWVGTHLLISKYSSINCCVPDSDQSDRLMSCLFQRVRILLGLRLSSSRPARPNFYGFFIFQPRLNIETICHTFSHSCLPLRLIRYSRFFPRGFGPGQDHPTKYPRADATSRPSSSDPQAPHTPPARAWLLAGPKTPRADEGGGKMG